MIKKTLLAQAGSTTVIKDGYKMADRWGNITGEPLESIAERHGDNFFDISVYRNGDGFSCGFKLKIGGLIRQKPANIKGAVFKTAEGAIAGAKSEIRQLLHSLRLKKISADFIQIWYNQPGLFKEVL